MIRAAAFLRNVPILAELPDPLLERLADQVAEVHVGAGSWILREGDLAESVFIVRSGRVEVIDEGPPEALIRILRRGDVLGELALLREGTRSVSARARRDTELLELGRTDFEALIMEAPSFAVGLTRAMGAQLAVSRTPVAAASPPQTVAVVGLDAAVRVPEVASALADALGTHGSVATLTAGDLSAIDQAERDVDRVVLQCGSDPTADWTALGVREAHLVLAVTSGTPDRQWLRRATALQGCELLVLGPGVSPATLTELQPREVQVVVEADRRSAALEATGRRMAGRSLGLVLSGGGARALAHLGVVEELRSAGFTSTASPA
jgi:NTE family protein